MGSHVPRLAMNKNMGRKIIEQKCKGCNKTYQAVESEIKRGNGKYCSRRCSFDSRIKIEYDIICGECDIKFKSDRITSKFCSKKCSNKNTNNRVDRKNQLSEDSKNKIGNLNKSRALQKYLKNPKQCKKCNKILSYDIRTQTYCNDECKESNKDKMTLRQYRTACNFKFSLNSYSSEFDFNLIKENGWYSPTNKNNNLKGVSRDHIFSVKNGYLLAIDPEIISHPANCRLIKQSENSSKNSKNGISLSQLLNKIKTWETKYNRA